MKALAAFYNDPPTALQGPPNGHRSGPDTTLGVAGLAPTPIRPPRPLLRDAVRQRAPRTITDPTGLFYPGDVNDPPVGVTRGLFTSMEEAHRGGEGEIVDLVYRALRADPGVIAWLRARDIDIDEVWALARARGRRS